MSSSRAQIIAFMQQGNALCEPLHKIDEIHDLGPKHVSPANTVK